jgi:hypothetical protein
MSNHVDCSGKLKKNRYSCDNNELNRSMMSTGNCRNELYESLYELKRSLYELKTSQELTTSLTSTRTVR